MDWVCPNEGKLKILEELFRSTGSREAFVLDQFVTNVTVGDASTGTDFTIASYTGYAQIAIARGDFSAAFQTGNVGYIQKTASPSWTCTAGASQTVYGVLIRGATSGKIYYGVNYTTPRSMGPGATDTIDPLQIAHKTFV